LTNSQHAAKVYNESKDQLCKAPPRLNYYSGDIKKKNWRPAVFQPNLEYYERADGSISDNSTQFDGAWVLDSKHWKWRANLDGETAYKDILPGGEHNPDAKDDIKNPPPKRSTSPKFWDQWDHVFSLTSNTAERYSAKTKCADIENGFAGPDWANSAEKLYCHMRTGEVLPFCADAQDDRACFDIENEVLREGVSSERKSARDLKTLKKTQRWDFS
jgi:hypothetical protein